MRHGITEMNEYLSLHRYDAEDFKDPLMWVRAQGWDQIRKFMGLEDTSYMGKAEYFRTQLSLDWIGAGRIGHPWATVVG